jgi:hypothetical protein
MAITYTSAEITDEDTTVKVNYTLMKMDLFTKDRSTFPD